MHEFGIWIDNQLLKLGTILEDVLQEFTLRFTGSLKELFKGLSLHNQL